MNVGDTRTLSIRPEEGYGLNPQLVQVYPVIQIVSTVFPRVIELPLDRFEATFRKHEIEDVVTYPGTSINMTILNIGDNVSLSYNLRTGDQIPSGAPWNETVVKIDDKNVTVKYDVKKNETIQFQNVHWNTTVTDVYSNNITLRHNPIPDIVLQTMTGRMMVSFNETLAGKTLIFNMTLKSIEKP